MEEKNATKISLSTFFLIIAIIVIIVMGIFIYKLNNDKAAEIQKSTELQSQVNSLNKTISDLQEKINNGLKTTNDLQEKIDNISNIINTNEKKEDDNTQQNTSVSYIVLEVEDTEALDLEYKNKKITDKQLIDSLMKIIDSATPYKEKGFIGDFGDIPPCAIIYLDNGEKYTIAAGDDIRDDGEIVNLMTKWYSDDGSNKSLYKVDTKLGEYIETLFNN